MAGIPVGTVAVAPQEIIAEMSKTIGALYLETVALKLENEKLKKILADHLAEQTKE